jgi:hypothetical protein
MMNLRGLLIAAGCAAAIAVGVVTGVPQAHSADSPAGDGQAVAGELRFKGTVQRGMTQGTWVIRVVSSRGRISIVDVAPDSPKASEVVALYGKTVVVRGTKVGAKGHEMLRVYFVEEVPAKP